MALHSAYSAGWEPPPELQSFPPTASQGRWAAQVKTARLEVRRQVCIRRTSGHFGTFCPFLVNTHNRLRQLQVLKMWSVLETVGSSSPLTFQLVQWILPPKYLTIHPTCFSLDPSSSRPEFDLVVVVAPSWSFCLQFPQLFMPRGIGCAWQPRGPWWLSSALDWGSVRATSQGR